jgi:hypothetical protein
LREPATQRGFKTLAAGAADLARTLGARAFTAFLKIMLQVALTALPAVRAAHDVANALENVAGKPGKIRSATQSVVGQFKSWARLAGSVFGLVKDIFGVAAPGGKSLADSMRHVVDHWRDWIRANPDKVKQFFRDAVQKTKNIVGHIKDAVNWLKNHLPKAAKIAGTAFSALGKIVKAVADAIQKIMDAEDFLSSHGLTPGQPGKAANRTRSRPRRLRACGRSSSCSPPTSRLNSARDPREPARAVEGSRQAPPPPDA